MSLGVNSVGGYYPASGCGQNKAVGQSGKSDFQNALSKENMSPEEYKTYFNQQANAQYVHPSQANRNNIVEITDAAYERMRTDPEYEQKVLNCLATNKAVNFGSHVPTVSYLHIDDTWEKSYGYTQGMEDNTAGASKSSAKGGGNDFWERRAERHEEYMERSQELQMERVIFQARQLQASQQKCTDSGIGKAIASYDANIFSGL